ncbi:MAG: fibronectin-binding domain-containing protein, partial [Rubrivirga sp.]
MDYYTLRALALEWDALLSGTTVADVWTQSPRELSVALENRPVSAANADGVRHTIRIACDPALPLLFRSKGSGRQKRNTADVLPGMTGRAVVGVRVADRDRHVFVVLEGGSRLQIVLFGPTPNVYWVQEGVVRDAFLDHDEWVGEPAPAPRPAPVVDTVEAFRERWKASRKTLGQATAAAAPLLT